MDQIQIFQTAQGDHSLHPFLLSLVPVLLYFITLVVCLLGWFLFVFFPLFVIASFVLTGNMQGLHNIHGNFSVANMPGALGSRSTTMNNIPSSGVQQAAGNLSSGRFGSNNIPVALSQARFSSLIMYMRCLLCLRCKLSIGMYL